MLYSNIKTLQMVRLLNPTPILETLRLRYSYPRFQWLVLALSGMTIMTLSAQELWGTNLSGIAYSMTLYFCPYVILFVSLIMITDLIDYARLSSSKMIVVACSIVSVVVDLGFLLLAEFFVLLTIGQIASDLLRSVMSMILVVLPWVLGEIALSSLTVGQLRKRAEELQKKVEKLKSEAEELDKRRQVGENSLKEFEKERKKFLKSVGDENRGDENE